jgi:hypothetical protein
VCYLWNYKPSFESTKVLKILKQVVRLFLYIKTCWCSITLVIFFIFIFNNYSKAFHIVNKNPDLLSFYLLYLDFC